MQGEKVFVSWSGGKDSYLSLIKAREAGLDIKSLMTFIGKDGDRSMSHGLPLELLQKQSRALGIPHVLEPVSWDDYEQGFQRIVSDLKEKSFTGGVFGDINLTGHRQWVEDACGKAGINPYLPLWGMEEEAVLAELLSHNAELLIVALRSDLLDPKWLGRILGQDFIQELTAAGLSPCGESGEYHTMALFGPLFKKRVELQYQGTRQSGQVLFLDYL